MIQPDETDSSQCGILTLEWDAKSTADDQPPTLQVVSLFTLIDVQLVAHAEQDMLDFSVLLQRPNQS